MEVVNKFCYLGDLTSTGDVKESNVVRIRFRELFHVLTSKVFSLCTKGNIFQACVRSVGSETWAVQEEDLAKLERNDMMVQWMNA